MFSCFSKLMQLRSAQLGLVFTGLAIGAASLSAATLTVVDETGTVATLGIQSGNSVALRSSSNGNLTLTLDGYYVSVSTNANDADTGGGDTGGGDTGGGDTGGGDTGGGDTGGGDTGSGDTGGGDTGGGDTGGSGSGGGDTGGDSVNTDGYCAGNDDDLADCRTDGVFDPWVATSGEVPIWIRDKKTEVFPFTLPARADAGDVRYGYLQLTTTEAKRDPVTQDVFRAWWSETPNGAPLENARCEWWGVQARTNLFWTQDASIESSACYLGTESRVLYLNFETRCVPSRYRGTCDSETPQKSADVYQFDVARYVKGY